MVLSKRFLKNFASPKERPVLESFFKKVSGWRLVNFIEEETFSQMLFLVNVAEIQYSIQSWTQHFRQILKIKRKQVFLWNVLQVIFYNFLAQLPKVLCQLPNWVLPFNYKYFSDFHENSVVSDLSWFATCEVTLRLHLWW